MFKLLATLVLFYSVYSVNSQTVDTCPDRNALNLVDAYVRRYRNDRGFFYPDVNFHNLDSYRVIDVVKANVTVLCEGMIKKFSVLQYLSLIGVGIQDIQENAFQEVPHLEHLSLSASNISTVKSHYFKHLPALKTLYLTSCNITNIEQGAFDHLVNLERIYLNRNNFGDNVIASWFSKNSKLNTIDLSVSNIKSLPKLKFASTPGDTPRNLTLNLAYNNLTTLPSKTFTINRNNVMEIRLSHNMIRTLEPDAIIVREGNDDVLPYLTLFLDHNAITTLPAGFMETFEPFYVVNLVLNSNFISCVSTADLAMLKVVAVSLHLINNTLTCDCMNDLTNVEREDQIMGQLYFSTTSRCEVYKQGLHNFYYEKLL